MKHVKMVQAEILATAMHKTYLKNQTKMTVLKKVCVK